MNAKDISTKLWEEKYFSRSKRQCNLFEFLLENSLSDAPLELNQYIIAVEVLGRGENFDPYNDSIVRSEISRLRKSLDIYNAKQEPYEFTIPKGRYNLEIIHKNNIAPADNHRTTTASLSSDVSSSRLKYNLAVCGLILFLSVIGIWALDNKNSQSITANLQAECSQAQPNLAVVFDTKSLNKNSYVESLIRSSINQYSNIEMVPDAAACSKKFAPAYELSIRSNKSGGRDILLFEFKNLKLDETLHLHRFELPKDHIFNEAFDIKVHGQVSKLLRPYGILPRHAVTQAWLDPDYRQSYQCNIDFYDMLRTFSEREYLNVRACLKTAIDRDKYTLDNLGILAQMYGAQVYGGQPKIDENAKGDMLKIFDDIGSDWIKSTELTIAKIFTEASRENYSLNNLASLLYTAQNRYKDNAHIGLILAINYGYGIGDWEKALTFHKRYSLIGDEEDSLSFLVGLGHSLTLETQTEFSLCKNAYAPKIKPILLMVNVCAYRSGNQEWVDKTEQELAKMGLSDINSRIAIIRLRRYEPNLFNVMKETWENIDLELETDTPP